MRNAPPILPLRLDNISLHHGDSLLINQVSVNVPEQGVTMLVGANGAGKSLLLRLLAGLIMPSAGQILWGGQKPSRQQQRRVGFLHQYPIMLRRKTWQNLAYIYKLMGEDKPKQKAHQRLEAEGLLALANIRADNLSGGEQQKLALIRALALQPDILLLDEPTAHLDPNAIIEFEARLQDETNKGLACLFVSHNIAQTRRLADNVIFMHEGQVTGPEPRDEFFTKPSHKQAQIWLDGRR